MSNDFYLTTSNDWSHFGPLKSDGINRRSLLIISNVCTLTLFRKIYQQFGTFGIMFVTFSITTYIIVFILTFYDVRILDQTVPLQWISYFCRLLWNSSSTCFNCWFTIWSYSHWANVNHGMFINSANTQRRFQ